MTISTTAVLHVLAGLIILLLGLLTAAVSVLLSRHDGDRWTTAIRQGSIGFVGAVGVLSILYGIVIVAS
ncbi:hypothetical protein [Nocardia sp. NPDC050710]|uniref:hypothetical protein n=1 Tax=Nocardia sp. NPDC050710 TaxID=3157220 RepID=UPI0033C89D3B